MQDARHTVHPVTTLQLANWLVWEYCQTPQFDEMHADYPMYFTRTIADALEELITVFDAEAFSTAAEERVRVLTRRIRQQHESHVNLPNLQQFGYEIQFDSDGARYDIIQVVRFIEQSVGKYPFTYWNGERAVCYHPFRTPSPEPTAHSNGRLTPQPHDMHTDTLILMRSVLKKVKGRRKK